MTPLTSAIARQAMAAKQQAKSNRTRKNLTYLAALTVSIVMAMAWFVMDPLAWPKPENLLMPAGAIGIVIGALAHYLGSRHMASAVCPVCQYDWDIAEGRSVPSGSAMPEWTRCPGCQLPMTDDVLARCAENDRAVSN